MPSQYFSSASARVVISIYDVQRAVADKATVPIYYESRVAKLGLNQSELPKIDEQFEAITEAKRNSSMFLLFHSGRVLLAQRQMPLTTKQKIALWSLAIPAAAAIIVAAINVVPVFRRNPDSRPPHASIGFFSGTTLEEAARQIAQKYNGTVRFSECEKELLTLKIDPGQLTGATPADLLGALQDRVLNPPFRIKYRVNFLEAAGVFEVVCAGSPAEVAPRPGQTPAAQMVSSIGLRLRLIDCLQVWVGEHEVTQKEFSAVMGQNPSLYQGADRPVDRICLPDAQEFCRKLTQMDQTAGILQRDMAYRLPREEEFEAYFDGSNANEAVTSLFEKRDSTLAVGTFAPNRFGLYDVLGNVWEWMSDGTLRGACWDTAQWRDAQIGYRLVPNPNYNCQNFGFRCVLAHSQ